MIINENDKEEEVCDHRPHYAWTGAAKYRAPSLFRSRNIIAPVMLPPQKQGYGKCIFHSTLALSCSCVEPSLAFATRTTSKHQRITWPGLYRKLIECLHIVVWHMRASARLLEVTWLRCNFTAAHSCKCSSMYNLKVTRIKQTYIITILCLYAPFLQLRCN